jgi:hypothetical protein
MGVNAASKNKEDAKKFLEWLTTPEFAEIYANALPGFFPLSQGAVKIKDDLAATLVGWRKDCKSTIRNSYQILSRGTPNLENELWNVSAQVINGTLTPEAAGKQLQDGLDKWYKPAVRRLRALRALRPQAEGRGSPNSWLTATVTTGDADDPPARKRERWPNRSRKSSRRCRARGFRP